MSSTEKVGQPVRLDWLERLPKVELHLHLEGAIPQSALWQLICKYGGDPRVPSLESLPGQFVYRDSPDFITRWLWCLGHQFRASATSSAASATSSVPRPPGQISRE